MRHVHVIGGGLAGLSAALALTDAGRRVTVYEASPHLGGRCRSYHDAKLGRLIDNGTHALAGANPAALALLERLGHRGGWIEADDGALRIADLEASSLRIVAPPTLASLLPSRATDLARPNPRDMASLARTCLGPDRPVGALFARTPFYRDVIEPLTVAALNTEADQASSKLLAAVLRAGMKPAKGVSSPLMPLIARHGLGPDLVDPLSAAIRSAGGTIILRARIDDIVVDDGRVRALSSGGEMRPFDPDDTVCLAVPAQVASRFVPGLFGADDLIASAIVNAHFIVNAPMASAPRMVGVLGGHSQWLALRGDMISTTVSAADALVGETSETIADLLWSEAREACSLLGQTLPERPAALRIVKERWATLRQVPGLRRPACTTRLANLVLAGDWTATGLPFTIEGAIRSGQTAARTMVG